MYLCTYFDINYSLKGLACLHTLHEQNKDAKILVICLDDESYALVTKHGWKYNAEAIHLIQIEDHFPVLLTIKNTRLLKEYYATLSPFVPLYLFNTRAIDVLFYTDADIAFWNNPAELLDIFGSKSIMVCDHGFEPPRSNVRFNVGILGYRNDEYCLRFLKWWGEKCIEWCKWETMPDGRCADQGYLNILHPDYDAYNALSCPHPGVNLAPWNIGKHKVTEENGIKLVDGQNLICYHYHEFRLLSKDNYYPTGWAHSLGDRRVVYDPYFNLLIRIGENLNE